MEIITDKKPLVSVIIDTYNYGHFIEEAIDSVLNQTFPQKDMEIIVVDDGSTDDTPERVKKYKDRIKYIYKENEGQASAFNVGFENTRGEFIILCDSDDYCLPNRVERVVDEFEKYKKVVLVLNPRQIISDYAKIFEEKSEYHDLELNWNNVKKIIESSYGTSRTSLRKSALRYILPVPSGLRIEADLFLLSLIWFGNLSCLKDQLTVYRVHTNNLFHTSDRNKIPLKIECIRYALTSIIEKVSKNPNFDKKLAQDILFPYEVELKELEVIHNAYQGRAKRNDLFRVELKKMQLHWYEWGKLYKLYKIIRLPVFLAFSPSFVLKLSEFYSKKGIYRFRDVFFPNKV